MARVKQTAKLIDTLKEVAADEGSRPQAEHEEDISDVQVSPSELMAREKPEPSLRFGSSKFYAKIEFPGVEGGAFPLALKVEAFAHRNQAVFDKFLPGFNKCEAAFRLAAKSIGGRDLVEEYLAAKVCPLSSSWEIASFAKPASKKGKAMSKVVEPLAQIVIGKPPRQPTSKVAASRVEAQKRTTADPSKYLFRITEADMGSPNFMKVLRATELRVPRGLGGRGQPVDLYLDQFGSLRASPDSVGAVIIDLHRGSSRVKHMINLVDDSDEEVPKVAPRFSPKETAAGPAAQASGEAVLPFATEGSKPLPEKAISPKVLETAEANVFSGAAALEGEGISATLNELEVQQELREMQLSGPRLKLVNLRPNLNILALKSLMANKALAEKIKQGNEFLLKKSVEKLQEKAEELEKIVKKLHETAANNEKVLDNLRETMEKDASKVAALQREVMELKAEAVRKDELIQKLDDEADTDQKVMDQAIREACAQGQLIYEEYKKALAGFSVEPSPVPEDPEGGVAGLLNWILGEFTLLSELLGSTADNAAVVSCGSLLAILNREGCQDSNRLSSRDFVYPSHTDLSQNIENIQTVKKSFVWKFWKVKALEAEMASVLESTDAAGTSDARPADGGDQEV
ncbi:hypothetical protein C2845_PM09G11790 [Panicum miliaceum]|uniref:Uncharacterized protein n=1 Tax=Panicum miliaceum TaxID=4540 RepID=A0A3L6S099_PANMI|nr:hypothetical protein C2845_PM09G11790 [Panicum miliaceum]